MGSKTGSGDQFRRDSPLAPAHENNESEEDLMYEFLEKYLPRDKRVRMGILMAADVLALCLASFLGLFVRFDLNISRIPPEYARAALEFLPYYILASLVIFFLARMYSTMWSVAGVREALHVVAACGLASLVQIAGMMLLQLSVPRSFFLVSFAALCAEELGIRLSYRVVISLFGNHSKKAAKRIMIVGAGTSGSVILKEMTTSSLVNGCVVCFVDDDKNKAGKFLNGVPVAGNRNDIPRLAEEYKIDEIYIAIPSASAKERKAIIEICRETGCQVKILPGIYQLINGEVSIAKLRNVEIEDLLGRDPIRVNLDEIMGYVSGKVVLVTGGGGSIGSELCRQVASHNPKQLIIFDIYENNAYDIQLELKEKYPDLDLVVLIGSVRNTHRIETVFEKYRPDIVYHAAAHKHVPLMEDSPNEAIKNNVFGTYKTAKAADKYGTSRFGLIYDETGKTSNDNIYGAGDVSGTSPIWPAAVKEGIVAASNMAGVPRKMTDFFASKATMNFLGIPSMSLGDVNSNEDGITAEVRETEDSYKKILHKDGKIVGAVLQGDLAYGGILQQLIARKIDVGKVKKPIFDIDYSDFFHIKENFEFYYESVDRQP